MSDHARLSPSNHRWPHCAGSVREEAAYEDIPGESAIDGTGSHLLLEMSLNQGVPAANFEGQIIGVNHEDKPNGWIVAKDRIDRVQQCLDYVRRRYFELQQQFPECQVIIEAESKSDPGAVVGRDDWHGTCDITITCIDPGGSCKFLETIDYKDGRGWVAVDGNPQLIGYLGGKLYVVTCGSKTPCRMTIVQPKTNPVVRYVDTTKAEVMNEVKLLGEAAARTDDPDAPLVSGPHCQWCKHNPSRGGECTEKSEDAIRRIEPMTEVVQTGSGALFEVISETFGDITQLPAEKLADLADARAGVEAVFDKVEAEIERRIEAGERVDGYAMRPGKGANQWRVGEEEVVKMLKARRLKKDDIFPPKLISPAQVMKHPALTEDQKKKIEAQYIDYVPGKLKLTKVERLDKNPEALFAEAVQTEPAAVSFM